MSESEKHILTILTTSSAVFISLIAFIVYMVLLYQKNLASKQKELFKMALHAQEREQERIARDIHDQVGPILSGLRFRIDNLDDESDLSESKDQSLAIIDKIIDDLRSASYNLMPKVLYTFGLIDAIEDCCIMLSQSEGIDIQFNNILAEKIEFRKDVQLNLFRAIQEILNNAIKYSDCMIVQVEVLMDKDCFLVSISDNGKGFDLKSIQADKRLGIGIQNIHTRMELINGICILATAPGAGTRYTLKLHKTKF